MVSGIYNSSKAALALASETWRHELAPLGVRTMTLVTTGVKTNAFKEDRTTPLPESSLYFAIRHVVHGLADGHLQDSGITTREYATTVIREIEKGTVGLVWAGGQAFSGRWGWFFSPQFVKVSETELRNMGSY